jgi:hypothetical protein
MGVLPRDRSVSEGHFGSVVIGMYNEQEIKVQTRGHDRGNPTPRRQVLWRVLLCAAPVQAQEILLPGPLKGAPVGRRVWRERRFEIAARA